MEFLRQVLPCSVYVFVENNSTTAIDVRERIGMICMIFSAKRMFWQSNSNNQTTIIMKYFAISRAITRLSMMLLLSALSFVFAPLVSTAITVGEHYRGGIVFYVDGSGEHGLVAAKTNITGKSNGMKPGNFSWYDAKEACKNFESDGYHDWFLPNAWQLNQLYKKKDVVGGFADHIYWSSSQDDGEDAWYLYFYSGDQNHEVKLASGWVRPVRAF